MVNTKPNIISPIKALIFDIFRFRLGGVSSVKSSSSSSSTSPTICSSAIYLSKWVSFGGIILLKSISRNLAITF